MDVKTILAAVLLCFGGPGVWADNGEEKVAETLRAIGIQRKAKYDRTYQALADLNFVQIKVRTIEGLEAQFRKQLEVAKLICKAGEVERCADLLETSFQRVNLNIVSLVSLTQSKVYGDLRARNGDRLASFYAFLSTTESRLRLTSERILAWRTGLNWNLAALHMQRELRKMEALDSTKKQAVWCELSPLRLKRELVVLKANLRTALARFDGHVVLDAVRRARMANGDLGLLAKSCENKGEVENLSVAFSQIEHSNDLGLAFSLGKQSCLKLQNLDLELRAGCQSGRVTQELLYSLHREILNEGEH